MRHEILHGDARELVEGLEYDIVITDPPYNQGYHYHKYADDLDQERYLKLLLTITRPAVVIHYPEETINLLPMVLGHCDDVITWVYPSNTGKQHRLISFWGLKPDRSKIKQPYKNPEDKRIQERMANGAEGASMYDWLEMNQVKNVSEEKTEHPCQIPLELMKTIIAISTNEGDTILDPFAGSGTTILAAKALGRSAIGIEVDEKYVTLARERLAQDRLL